VPEIQPVAESRNHPASASRDDEATRGSEPVTRARLNVVRPAARRPTANRTLEGGLSAPITGRPEFMASRIVAFVVSGVAAMLLLDHRNAITIGVTLFAAAACTPMIPRVPPRSWVSQYQAFTDLIIIVALMHAAPALWPMAMLWIGTNQAWHGLTSPPSHTAAVSAGSLVTIAVVGLTTEIEMWPYAALTAALIGASFAVYGYTLRKEIWENESALTDALAAAGAVVHHSDLDAGSVVRIEGDLQAITGWTAEEWCEIDHRAFLHPDDIEAYWVDVDAVAPNTIIDRLARKRRKDGTYVWMRDVALVTENSRGHRALRGFSLDVTELEEANATIARQLRHDTLTGLPNRLALNERLAALLGGEVEFALMITDLDRFKEVNDTLGHEAGDQLLETIARRLADAVRPGDLVARLGGDEYAIVVVGDTDEPALHALAARLSTECARPVVLNGIDVAVATSTGVALRSRSGRDRATMLRHADIAMYEAKRGSESFRVFDASLEQTSTLRLTLTASLRDAIDDGQLGMFFQPKYDMTTRRLVGAEGLSRWRHPEFGLLTPAAFLDIVLMSENAARFAVATIRHAADMIRRLAELGTPMPVAANVAMRALRDPGFAPAVLRILAEAGVSAELLVLELTESDPLWPNAQTATGLQSLVEAGVQLSIDDFGTGHSSLERLRVLRIHELKIDRSFVDGMVTDPLQRQIVRTVIDLAKGLDCQVVAEGVETEEQVQLLLELGCAVAQGYLFARPMPPEEFLALAHAEAIAATVGT
jgi:diguanylate cyclase (GGDEF)-like protein/PAS domain S-box-containing protein